MTPHESGFSVQNAGLKAVIPDLMRIRVANVENESPPVHTNERPHMVPARCQRSVELCEGPLRTFKPWDLDHGRSERAVCRSRVEPILADDVRVELGDCDHRGKII